MLNHHQNIFTKILSDNWECFKGKFPSYADTYYDEVITKVLGCADPTFGFAQYMCSSCGDHDKIVAFSCKTKFCLRCARVFSENFTHKLKERLHPDVIYRHLILTIPEQLRQMFYQNRKNKKILNDFFAAGWAAVKSLISMATGLTLKCGAVIIMHSAGRKSDYKPHLHILLMAGGLDEKEGSWCPLGSFSFWQFRLSWQDHLLKMAEKWLSKEETQYLTAGLKRNYPNGFVFRLTGGSVPKNSNHLIKYLSKYLARPQISVKRIKSYDDLRGEVVYEFKSHESGRVETEKSDVMTFIGRMVQQILPKSFQRVRYFGLAASKNQKRLSFLLTKATGVEESKVASEPLKKEENDKLSYADCVKKWWNDDPFKCPGCGSKMELTRIWTKAKGFVYSLFKKLFGYDIGPPGSIPDILGYD